MGATASKKGKRPVRIPVIAALPRPVALIPERQPNLINLEAASGRAMMMMAVVWSAVEKMRRSAGTGLIILMMD